MWRLPHYHLMGKRNLIWALRIRPLLYGQAIFLEITDRRNNNDVSNKWVIVIINDGKKGWSSPDIPAELALDKDPRKALYGRSTRKFRHSKKLQQLCGILEFKMGFRITWMEIEEVRCSRDGNRDVDKVNVGEKHFRMFWRKLKF